MVTKDTGRALGAADQVEAGGDHVGGAAAVGQPLGQRHLVEVVGRVQTVLVHLQRAAQSGDAVPRWRHTRAR